MPQTQTLDLADAAHLLRRASFGGTASDLKKLTRLSREQAAARLLSRGGGRARGPRKSGRSRDDLERLQRWWLRRMLKRKSGLREKMVLFWHDHFPSSYGVGLGLAELSIQNATFRRFGLESFRDLVYEVTRDPAMLAFLDGRQNRAGAPNENYARELMELFTLGPTDVNGVENYTQQDVVEMARALTGFRVEGSRQRVYVDPASFDAGTKVIFEGRPFEARGPLGVESPEGDRFPPGQNVIDILFTHRDSDGRPTLARFIARKLWEWFAYPDPSLEVVDELADAFERNDYAIGDLLFAIFTHEEFYSERARSSTAKTPVDFVLQTMRALGVRTRLEPVPAALKLMGMELFDPPGVEGWNHGEAWLSTSHYLARLEFADAVAHGRDRKTYLFRPERLWDPAATHDEIVDDLLARLHVAVPPATRDALITYLGSNPVLTDDEWFEQKYLGLLVLLLTLPEYQVH
jgi:uncharacterized protein (DUF1800 family)